MHVPQHFVQQLTYVRSIYDLTKWYTSNLLPQACTHAEQAKQSKASPLQFRGVSHPSRPCNGRGTLKSVRGGGSSMPAPREHVALTQSPRSHHRLIRNQSINHSVSQSDLQLNPPSNRRLSQPPRPTRSRTFARYKYPARGACMDQISHTQQQQQPRAFFHLLPPAGNWSRL